MARFAARVRLRELTRRTAALIDNPPLRDLHQDPLRRAELASDAAIAALREAEHSRASEDELLQRCDDVIRLRLSVYAHQEEAGWQPSPALRRQLTRDAALIDTPADPRRSADR